MTAAPVGAVVKLYVDAPWPLEPGCVLTTPTKRAYLVIAVRMQTKGKRRGRQHLQAVVADPQDLPLGAPTFGMRWYKRGRGR